jgi:hypothetical protein
MTSGDAVTKATMAQPICQAGSIARGPRPRAFGQQARCRTIAPTRVPAIVVFVHRDFDLKVGRWLMPPRTEREVEVAC